MGAAVCLQDLPCESKAALFQDTFQSKGGNFGLGQAVQVVHIVVQQSAIVVCSGGEGAFRQGLHPLGIADRVRRMQQGPVLVGHGKVRAVQEAVCEFVGLTSACVAPFMLSRDVTSHRKMTLAQLW